MLLRGHVVGCWCYWEQEAASRCLVLVSLYTDGQWHLSWCGLCSFKYLQAWDCGELLRNINVTIIATMAKAVVVSPKVIAIVSLVVTRRWLVSQLNLSI